MLKSIILLVLIAPLIFAQPKIELIGNWLSDSGSELLRITPEYVF